MQIAMGGVRSKKTSKNTYFTIATSPLKKKFCNIPENENNESRSYTKQLGLPSQETYIASGKIKYNADSKMWGCLICHKTSTKYNRRQIIKHVKTSHRAKTCHAKQNRKRGAYRKENDRILQMEHDYGRIATQVNYGEITGARIGLLKCTRFIYNPLQEKLKQELKDNSH